MVASIVAVGRVRNAGLASACEEYTRRARRTLKIEIREVAEAGRRAGTAARTRQIEGERLESALPVGAYRIGCTRGGRALSSADFAAQVRAWRDGARDIAFVLGGAFGLDPALVERCDTTLSLSPMTLPHDLARLVLLEQLYRTCTIIRGEPYHKGADA